MRLILEKPLAPVLRYYTSWLRREKLRINDLRVLHKTRTQSTRASIFGAPRWIAVATGNIHMKTSQEQKKRCEPFIRAVFVLDKTWSYKWYSSRLIFPRINGPIVLFAALLALTAILIACILLI